MNRWSGKVAIVTGASGGIGAVTCKLLVSHGIKVVGLARRVDKLQQLTKELGKDKFCAIACDITKEDDILKAFKQVEDELGGVDILVNNAGVVSSSMIIDSPTEEIRRIVDTNLIAPAVCSREAVQSMRKRKVAGAIININSVAGQFAEALHFPLGMYCASKYGLRALSTELRHEIILSGLNIKVTNISPGAVLTDMLTGVMDKKKDSVFSAMHALKDVDVANSVIFALAQPEGVEIPEVTIIPQNEVIGLPLSTRKM